MGKPIESRIGGSNSSKALAEKGLNRTGSHPDVTVVVVKTIQGDKTSFNYVRVNPIIVSGPDGGNRTLFKPTKKALQKLKGKDYHMVHLDEGILDNIPEEGIRKPPPEIETILDQNQAHPHIIYPKAMQEISEIIISLDK